MRRSVVRLLVVSPCLLLYVILLIRTAWLSDDAFIGYRTVDNFLHGYGLTFNVHERVQAYTNPLWLFVFCIPYSITREPYYTAIFLAMATSLVAVSWFAFRIARTTAGAALGILVLSASVAFVDYSTSGLENPLTHLILVVFLGLFWASFPVEDKDRPAGNAATTAELPSGARRRPASRLGMLLGGCNHRTCLLSFVAALAALNRMDTLLLYLPALALVFIRRRSWGTVAALAVGFVPLALWMGFALFYYGSAFPNSALAKLNNSVTALAMAGRGCYYLWNSLKWDPLTLVTVGGSLVLACWRRSAASVAVAAGIVLYLLYIVSIGGDFMSGRFLTAPLLAAVALLGTMQWTSVKRWGPALAGIVLLAALARTPTVQSGSEFGLSFDQAMPIIIAEHGVADERAFYYQGTGLLRAFAHRGSEFPDFSWATVGKQERLAAARAGRYRVIVWGTIGMTGYYAGPYVILIDNLALSDPLLARLPTIPDPYWRTGHFSRSLPKGYVDTVRSGTNTIQDPGVAEYYRHLALVTQGNLWDRNRLAAIWNLNRGAYEYLLEPIRRRTRQSPPMMSMLIPGVSKAMQDSDRAIQSDPNNPRVHMNRAYFHYLAKQPAESIEDLDRALALDPQNAPAHKLRGQFHIGFNHWPAAIEDFTRTIELDPTDIEAYMLRGNVYCQQRNWHEALVDFQTIIALSPSSPTGYYQMACALATVGNVDRHYRPPAQEPAEPFPAIRSLAWLLATHPSAEFRNGSEAVRYAEQARHMADAAELPEALDTVAASYAEAGRFQAACSAADEAIQAAKGQRNDRLATAIRDRQKLYEAGKPYHIGSAM